MDDTCTCPICFIHINNSIKLTLCNHTFCVECIKKWIDTPNYTCPCCRSNIATKDFNILNIEYISCEKKRKIMYKIKRLNEEYRIDILKYKTDIKNIENELYTIMKLYNKNEIDMKNYEKRKYDLLDKMKYRKFIHGHTLEFYDMEMSDLQGDILSPSTPSGPSYW